MIVYTVELTDQDLAVIAAGLGELPLKVAKSTFDKINTQVAKATAPATEPDMKQN